MIRFLARVIPRSLFCAGVSWLLAPCHEAMARQEAAPKDSRTVIALGQFVFCPGETEAHLFMSMRDRVASDLVRKYDCIVLSRSAGMTIKAERDLGKMSSVVSGKKPVMALPGADYAVYGSNFWGKGGSTELSLICDDLNSPSQSLMKLVISKADTPDSAAQAVEATAKFLNLKPRPPGEAVSGKIAERWAVLPFSRLVEKGSITNCPPDAELSASAILALQEANVLKGIVDRDEMTRLMAELKIESLFGSSEGAASKIAKILGADKIITGVVSPCREQAPNGMVLTHRLDLLLIDANTAVVLDAAMAACKPDELNSKAATLALELAKRKHVSPVLKASTPMQRKKEADTYTDTLQALSSWSDWSQDVMFVPMGIAVFESAYMLFEDDNKQKEALAQKLANFGCSAKNVTDFQARQIRNLVYAACDSLDAKFKKRNPQHCTLATASLCAKDYDEALRQLDSAKKVSNWNTDPSLATNLRGKVFMAKKEYRKAAEAYALSGNEVQMAIAYEKLGDKDSEYEHLKKIRYGGWLMNTPQPRRVLDMMKEREGAAAALEFLSSFDFYIKSTSDMQLRKALLLADTGKKLHAQQILYYLEVSYRQDKNILSDDDGAALQKKLAGLNAELGTEKCKMKKMKEICAIDRKYKFYIQPFCGISDQDVNDAVKMAEDFTGIDIVILPTMPLPTNYAYDKARGQYDGPRVIEAMRYARSLPKDGILLFLVIKEDLYNSDVNLRYTYAQWHSDKGTAIFSVCRMFSEYPKKMALQACNYLNYTICKTSFACSSATCLNGSDGSTAGISRKDFLLCFECEEMLKQLDLHKANRVFINPEIGYSSFPKAKIDMLNAYKAQIETYVK